MSRVTASDGNGTWEIEELSELWRVMWGSMAFAMATEANGGRCQGCGCGHLPCPYCLHECWLSR